MIEPILIAVLVIGCVGYILFLRSASKTPTPKPKKPKRKKKSNPEVPKEWGTPQPKKTKSLKPRIPSFPFKTPKKIHVPGLRTIINFLGVILVIVNFFISQATLMSAPATQPMFWLFFFNALYIGFYIRLRRRKHEAVQEEWGNE